jgi:type II secretory pathway predicted ATPase ExeA
MSKQNIYGLVDLDEDPFRISPDPRFFYHTKEHEDVLQRLYLSIEKKNGLNVIYGDYGTGKSTMAEILQRHYGNDDDYVVAKMATAKAKSEYQFYQLVLNAFNVKASARSTLESRTALETFSFEQNIGAGKTQILIIDEGEALTPTNIDILRTLLNFEAPDQKFLQMVIFGQMELLPKIKRRRNFVDRISLSYVINPLNIYEMREMIEFRLKIAGWNGDGLFGHETYETIHDYTMGFPRQTVKLCGMSLETCIMDGESQVTKSIVEQHGEMEKRLYGTREIRGI